MADGLVVYQSFVDSIEMLPEERRWPFFLEVFRYRMDGTKPEPQSDLERMALTNFYPTIDASVTRYDRKREAGKLGGRPRKYVDQTEAEAAYQRLGSWDAVADELAVAPNTLRRARVIWAERDKAKRQKRKNQDKEIRDKTEDKRGLISDEKTVSTVAPEGAPSPRPGDVGSVYRKRDGWYMVDEEGLVVKISDE